MAVDQGGMRVTLSADIEVIGIIREVREEVRNIFVQVGRIEESISKADISAASDAADRLNSLRTAAGSIISGSLSEAREKVNADPELRDHMGDSIVRLRLLWDDAWGIWVKTTEEAATSLPMKTPLSELLLECAYLTIPPRLNQNLKSVRIGGSVDFLKEFRDEVPDDELLKRVLRRIYDHPLTVGGVVDPKRGVIIKGSTQKRLRALTYLAETAVPIGCALLLRFRDSVGLNSLLSNIDSRTLSLAFIWAFIGFILHFLVAGKKQLDRVSATGGDSPTLGNWFLLLHVLYLRVIMSEFIVLVATLVSVGATKGPRVSKSRGVGWWCGRAGGGSCRVLLCGVAVAG